MPFDLSQYINPGSPGPMIDITAPYRQWQQQYLNEAQLAEQKRQADIQAAHQTRVSDDINSRFAIEHGQQSAQNNYEAQANRYKQQQALLAKARGAAAEGRWNEVESMMGTLKSLGADVGRQMDAQGRPIYRLQEGQAPTVPGEDYYSIQQKIQAGHGGELPRLEVNHFDNSLGTAAEETRPNIAPNPSQDPQASVPSQEQPSATPIPARPTDSSYDPYEINSGQLAKMNESRMQPLLEGLKNAFPYRYQGNAESLFGGIRALGGSPESTLEMLQKPLDTASRTWNAEMGAEGAMARAGMSQSGREDTQTRMLTNDGEKAAQRIAKQYGVDQAVLNSIEMNQIAEQLLSDNPNANADGVKALLSMREGNRLTDKDFNIGVTGLASNFEQLKAAVQHVYVNGLTADQKSNFRELVRMFQEGNKRKIAAGSRQMLNYVNKLRTEPERYGAWRSITGSIPDEFLPQEILDYDPATGSFGGQRAPSANSSRRSVSATAPTVDQATQAVDELSEFE